MSANVLDTPPNDATEADVDSMYVDEGPWSYRHGGCASAQHVRFARAYSAQYPLTQRRALPVRTVAYRRPGGRPVTYRGSGLRVSSATHPLVAGPRRPVSVRATVLVAVGAALATMWLLMLGQVSAAGAGGAGVPERLAVIQVEPGETLSDVASRVAPDAPRAAMEAKIRELNELGATTLQAGQTLVSPVG